MVINMKDCLETKLTVWHRRGEDPDGCAVYTRQVYDGMVEEHCRADEANALYPPVQMMTGFLFMTSGENADVLPKTAQPAGDLIAQGDFVGMPEDAAACGVMVYEILDTARPPRMLGGRLVDWCHFRASRRSGSSAVCPAG